MPQMYGYQETRLITTGLEGYE